MLARNIARSIIAVVLSAIVISIIVVQRYVMPQFRQLEQQEARTNMKRINEAIDREMYHLQTLCVDWSAWDDTYNFMEKGDYRFIESNMPNSTYAYNGLNLMYLVRNDGSFVWGKAYDFENDELMEIEEFGPNGLAPDNPWLAKHNKDYRSAILKTSAGLMLLAYCPIVHSDSSGPVVGTFFMGVLLSENLLQTMQTQTEVPFKVMLMSAQESPDDQVHITEKSLSVLSIQQDIHLLNPDLMLRISFEYPRKIYQQGLVILRLSWAAIIIIGSSLLVILLIFINRIVVRPIKKLKEHALAVSQHDAPLPPLFPDRRDELGILARSFDDMISRLFATRSRMLEMSFQSGLSEMARTFLHNIRNALSPVTLLTEEMKLGVSRLKNSHLNETFRLLADPSTDEQRKLELQQYIHLYEQRLQETCAELHENLQNIEQVQHSIEALLSYQEKWAHAQPVIESVQPGVFLRDVVHALPPGYSPQIRIIDSAQQIASIRMQRSTLLLVLSRLIVNGLTLMNNSEAEVILSADLDEVNAEWILSIRWEEMMLSKEQTEELFQREGSITERGDWHWVANTLHQMNIKFAFHGNTGTFTLNIPIGVNE